jgi:dolichyl-phosphate-mannose-protein mannosyltransferase
VRSTATRALVAVAMVTALAGALRFSDLKTPQRKVFDEIYYASDGCWYAGIDYRECGLDSDAERSWVHPPLGKQLIAAGIDAFGFDPFGWRVAAAIAGTLTVAIVGALAFLLFRSDLWAAVASLLLATEALHFVQSRIAMLDIFQAMFIALGFLLLVADRRRGERSVPVVAGGADGEADVGLRQEEAPDSQTPLRSAAPRQRGVWRPLRLLSGAAFGAAIAVKWSGFLAPVAAAVLALAWQRTRRKREGAPRPTASALAREAPGVILAFALVPFLVYSATWIPWLADRGFDLGDWFRHHLDMAGFHFHLSSTTSTGEPVHPYQSGPWTWFLLARPVAYYWQGDPSCCREILGVGNPVLFWGALVVVPYLALQWRRDWRAGVSVLPVLALYLPSWLLITRPLFLFYMTPLTPFLALAMTHALRNLTEARTRARAGPGERPSLAVAAGLVVAASVAAFVYLWPVLVGSPISRWAWDARMLNVWIWNWI